MIIFCYIYLVIFAATEVSGAVASWHLLPRNSRSITLPGFGVALTFHISYFKDFDHVLFHFKCFCYKFCLHQWGNKQLKMEANQKYFSFWFFASWWWAPKTEALLTLESCAANHGHRILMWQTNFPPSKKLNLDQLLSCQGSPPRKKEKI